MDPVPCMLSSLEEVKSEEFGDKKIDLNQISPLNGSCEPNDSVDETSTPNKTTDNDKSEDNCTDTPKKIKRKKPDTGLEVYTEVFDPSIEPISKKKKVVQEPEEDAKARLLEKMEFITNFVRITTKYSQFLEQKIENRSSSAGDEAVRRRSREAKKDSFDITKHLKYFEGGKLHPYQVEGVTWMTVLYENSVNGILADEMGLGKTIQIIALFSHLYERKVKGPFLIVAPLSTLGNWESEFKKFAPKIPVVRLQGSESQRKEQKIKINGDFYVENRKVRPVVLCSYQTPLYEQSFLERYAWTYIVVDEGHRIKNPDSKLSVELRALVSQNRLLLTGTPLQNDIKELWALFNFLMPELFQDIEGFSSLIELEDVCDKDKILANEAQTKIISTIHKVLSPFMLRREKKSVLSDSTVPKKEMIIYCPLTELQKYIYRAILQKDMAKLQMRKQIIEDATNTPRRRRKEKIFYNEKFLWKDEEHMFKAKTSKKLTRVEYEEMEDYSLRQRVKTEETPTTSKITYKENVPVNCPNTAYMCRLTMQNITMMLKKVTNHPYLVWCPLDPKTNNKEMFVNEDLIKHSGKLLVLDRLLPKLKAGGHKVLIFSTLVMFMDVIEEMLILRGYKFRRLDGTMDFDERNEYIEDFMKDPEVFLFLISTRAGGLGLNLTAADTVIFMDRDWNPMADLQAQDRCHRIGQTKPVMVYSLIAKNSIDELIVNRGDVKKRLEKLVIQEGKFKTLRRNPNENELKELEDLLNAEEELTKIHANGLIYSDEELDKILDRSDLLEEMELKQNATTSKK